jgi:cobalt/nickel transport system ATP-binding protein
LRINHGEAVGIVGANGAGKSTLLLLLTGLLLPSAGEIDVGGIPVSKKTLTHIRRHVGYLFQQPDDQLFMNTVYEDIAFGLRNYGLEEPEVVTRVQKILSTFGIAHLQDKAPYHLSGGEKSRAAIAAVLALEPDILLLDEPASNLDPKSRRSLINLLNSFPHTKLITSHDLDFILANKERLAQFRRWLNSRTNHQD